MSQTTTDPNPLVRETYERLGGLLERGDDVFVEEGPAMLQAAMEDPAFFEGVETDRAAPDEYTRAKVIGDEGRHVVRFMEWPPEYALLPHEHHGRPCFEVLVEGRLLLADVDARAVGGDEYELAVIETHDTAPGEAAVVDPREGEIHAVYSPVRSRSVHVYPDDSHHSVGYVQTDDENDRYRRERFRLRDT